MTRGDLRNLCLYWLDDLLGTYFTPVQVNFWLNNAQREVQKQLIQAGEYFYAHTVVTNTVTDYAEYALPSDFLKVHKLEMVASGTGVNQNRQMIRPVTFVQLDQVSQTSGFPAVYCLKQNCAILRPIPSQAWQMKLTYSYRVQDMTNDSDVPDVPIQYQEYVAVLATLDGFLKDNRDPSMVMTKKQYYLDLMKQDAQQRRIDAPRMVVNTMNGDNFGYLF